MRLQYAIFSAKNPSEKFRCLHNSGYELWHHTFKQTFQQLGSIGRNLYSDNFLLQDYITTISHGDQIVALICLNKIDSRLKASLDQSYLKSFPSSARSKIFSQAETIITANNLCVHPDWRKKITNNSLSELIIGLAAKQATHLNMDALVTISRNDKKINHILYQYGASLVETVSAHGIDSDITLTLKEDICRNSHSETAELIELLWKNRIFQKESKTNTQGEGYELTGRGQ